MLTPTVAMIYPELCPADAGTCRGQEWVPTPTARLERRLGCRRLFDTRTLNAWYAAAKATLRGHHGTSPLQISDRAAVHTIVTNLLRAAIGLAIVSAGSALAQEVTPEHAATVKRIMDSLAYKTAVGALQADHERWVREITQITEIPAPPFKEQVRATAFRDMLKAHGLIDVGIDAEGNAMGLRKGTGGGLVVVSAHLDTVFPEARM
jgi:hypothetical protein